MTSLPFSFPVFDNF